MLLFFHILSHTLHRNIYALFLKQDIPESTMYILKVARKISPLSKNWLLLMLTLEKTSRESL